MTSLQQEDSGKAAGVRIHVVKRLRNERLAPHKRETVAVAMIQVLRVDSSPDLRLQLALALAEFTDIDGVVHMLGSIALNVREQIDLRYTAFTSFERAGPTDERVHVLRQLSANETHPRRVCGVVLRQTTPHPLVPRGLSPPGPGARRNRSRPNAALWGLPRPARGEGRGEGYYRRKKLPATDPRRGSNPA